MKVTDIALPKWPALIVRGDSVTREQAAEIIIRTHGYLGCNDDAWEREAKDILGYPPDFEARNAPDGDFRDHLNLTEQARKRLGVLELEYLCNDQIMSSWIGGADDGWVKWDGRVQNSRGKNIGKWPSVTEVRDEWRRIAKSFPFLNLVCELWNCEACGPIDDTPGRAAVRFVVASGKVKTSIPKGEPLALPLEIDYDALFTKGERGCDAETLRWAVRVTEWSLRQRGEVTS